VRLLDSHDENGCTPLHLAVIGGHEHVLEYLIDAGVDVSSARRLRRTGCHARFASGIMPRDAVHSSECRAGVCKRVWDVGFLKI
jgi:ankyrin repeat protein